MSAIKNFYHEEITAICRIHEAMTSIIVNKDLHRSAWKRATASDALDFLDQIQHGIENGELKPAALGDRTELKKYLLNGAENWKQYSWGGCGLIYDTDIARRYCTPSELKKTRDGERNPNGREQWLDVQARALNQAAHIAINAIFNAD